jgi:D-alanyl-lipoteichoic acid acyltransferase DltB (MBOAT superfamily)
LLDYLGIGFNFPFLTWILPFGISFYTFQVIGYTLDIYWGSYKPEKNLGIYALFVAFFTKLVAGPIERGNRLIPQFYREYRFDYNRVKNGLLLMIWGFFQKIVIADNLKTLVDQVFNNLDKYEGFPLIIAMFAFAFQMFCDFSGYTDIAIGSAQVMGFDLMKNFDRPFASRTISEFWRRWHISLSSWANDYLYKPIVFNKRKWRQWAVVYAVAATFLFLGIWHGAKAAFLLFGVLMGGAFYFELLTTGFREKLAKKIPEGIYNNISVVVIFLFFAFSSILFRANTTSDGFLYYSKMFKGIHFQWYDLGLNKLQFISTLIFIFILEYVHHLQRNRSMRNFIAQQPKTVRWIIYIILLAVIFNFGEFNENKFIYLDF